MPDVQKNFSTKTKILSGFTLIELLLTISIMSLLSIFGVATYREYNQGKTLESSAQDVQNTLVLARSRASTQVKPDILACSSGRELYGYKVDFCRDNCSSSQNYRLVVVCGSNGEYSADVGNVKTLPSGVTFASTQPQSILFRVLTGEVVGASNINLIGFDRTYEINISATGVISSSSQSGGVPTPTPVPLPNTFYSLSANLEAGQASYNFAFNGTSSYYEVDMSTISDMSYDVYLSFGSGSSSPVIVSDPQNRWDKYTCGKILYWRVYNSDRSISSPIKTSTVTC